MFSFLLNIKKIQVLATTSKEYNVGFFKIPLLIQLLCIYPLSILPYYSSNLLLIS
jgi:hypothetical protein